MEEKEVEVVAVKEVGVVGEVVVVVVGTSVDVGLDVEDDRVDSSNVAVDRGVVMVTEVVYHGSLSRLWGLFSLLCFFFFFFFSLLPISLPKPVFFSSRLSSCDQFFA